LQLEFSGTVQQDIGTLPESKMTLSELGDYRNWEGKMAEAILNSVKSYGGWRSVFMTEMPRLISRFRNFFNVFPRQLKRLTPNLGSAHATNAQAAGCKDSIAGDVGRALNIHLHPTAKVCANNLALSGDAYVDEHNRLWLVTSPGGAVLHYGDKPTWDLARSYGATLVGQENIPVFKLVSPDGTGGSMECIVRNVNRQSTIGPIGVWTDVSAHIVTDPVQLGSYNYSETAVVGFNNHKMRDMDSDPGEAKFFINPGNLFSSLAQRVFPAYPEYVDDGRKVVGTRNLREQTVSLSKEAANELRKLQRK
jgi:hypothetical protein